MSITLLLLTSIASPPAEVRLPTRVTERPLTAPAGTFGVDSTFTIVDHELTPSALVMTVGATYSPWDFLTLDATLVTLLLKPDRQLGAPAVTATARFFEGPVDLGLRVSASELIDSVAGLQVGLPVLYRSRRFSFETGAYLELSRQLATIPALTALQLTEGLSVQAALRMHLPEVKPAEGFVEARMGIRYAWADTEGLVADFGLDVVAPGFILLGQADKFGGFELWAGSLTTRVYLD